MNLSLEDLVPTPDLRTGCAAAAYAGALEATALKSMLSLQYTAQARLMRSEPGAGATGWSEAEEFADRSARVFDRLSRAHARMVRLYRNEAAFDDARDPMDGYRSYRGDMIAMEAIFRTDPNAVPAPRESDEQAYIDASLARLRRYEPDWETLEQFRLRRAIGGAWKIAPSVIDSEMPATKGDAQAAGASPVEQLEAVAVEATASEPVRDPLPPEKNVKTENRMAAPEPDPAKAEKSVKMENRMTAAPPAPARRRGGQPGNRNSLKSGRHTAERRAARRQDSAMLRQARALEREVRALTRRSRQDDESLLAEPAKAVA